MGTGACVRDWCEEGGEEETDSMLDEAIDARLLIALG